jgi:sugar O-acyltransferase (sialic acid O-acetyltransferase NeuD family)
MDRESQRVVIVGAGGLGREALQTIRDQIRAGASVSIVGFLVDPEFDAPPCVKGVPVYRKLEAFTNDPTVRFVIAIGDPVARARYAARIMSRAGRRFASIVHPSSLLSDTVAVGSGTIILQAASITTDVQIGAHTVVNPHASIAHDCVLEDFVSLAPGVALAGGVHVETGCEIGTGAVVIPRQRIGHWSIIGAGAVVIGSVQPNSTMVGVPARCISSRPAGWQHQV